ncbi:hypothetical protein [Candidatus Nitrosotalea okcheonensis]|uniref:hypothetical protein n=1 Tax=Candidatus Nitrosotalea okcheonensis TaxID=1903276 RepID=UPI001300131F|nr:hypothetical protein [Candidatus Nitrosotalea okcheonensis]MDE1728186.1 hypothetical protein [Nitrososphaerota archaeon]
MAKKGNYDWIFDSISNLENITPKGFLLKKSTHGRYLDAFKLKPIKTVYFRKKIISELKRIKEAYDKEQIKIVSFDKQDTEDNALSVLDIDKFSSIKSTIDQISQSAEANSIDSLKSMERAKFSAMLFDIADEKSVIAIDTVSIFSKAFEKGGLVATYDEIGLHELTQDSALVFKFGLPCIYFEEKKKLLVIDRESTESIFNLLEHYQKKASVQFSETLVDIIKLDDGVFQSEIKNITVARRINNMIEGGLFTTDIELYKKHETIIKSHPEWDDELTQLVIEDNKVKLDSSDRFKSFLHLTSLDLMNPAIDPTQHFISFKKRKVRVNTTKIIPNK